MKADIADRADFASRVVAWQRHHGRHDLPWQRTRDPYRIWVSEIMLQQTQVASVIGYFQRFMQRFPDVRELAAAETDEVLRFWSGLGYYARARNLHRAAREIVESGGLFPRGPEEIALLPGIGRSTAAAIAAFAFGERAAILDGNVKRVIARHRGVEGFPGSARVEAKLWALAADLLPGQGASIEAYTQGLMDLGATVCSRSNPACGMCPVSNDCVARCSGRVGELPAPRPRKTQRIRKARWLVLRHRGRILLERRPPSGIWGGLLAFPELEGREVEKDCWSRFGCVVSSHRKLPRFAHAFTHFRLEVTALVCEVQKAAPAARDSAHRWVDEDSAAAEAVPTPVRALLRKLRAVD